MDEIVVDGEQISEYMNVMYNHLDAFSKEIELMKSIKDNVIWQGDAALECKKVCDSMVEKYLIFAKKQMIFIDYLSGYVDGYDEVIDEIKENFKKLNAEYGIEEDYG